MKKIYQESLLKSIIITTTIVLAISSLLVLVYGSIGASDNEKQLERVNNCIHKNVECEEKWETSDDNDWWRDDYKSITKDYEILSEKYDQDQALTIFHRKGHYEASTIWFATFRNLEIAAIVIGILTGTILHLVYKAKKKRN